jgi:hypothetical protein
VGKYELLWTCSPVGDGIERERIPKEKQLYRHFIVNVKEVFGH